VPAIEEWTNAYTVTRGPPVYSVSVDKGKITAEKLTRTRKAVLLDSRQNDLTVRLSFDATEFQVVVNLCIRHDEFVIVTKRL
jgi:hypothetical protein